MGTCAPVCVCATFKIRQFMPCEAMIAFVLVVRRYVSHLFGKGFVENQLLHLYTFAHTYMHLSGTTSAVRPMKSGTDELIWKSNRHTSAYHLKSIWTHFVSNHSTSSLQLLFKSKFGQKNYVCQTLRLQIYASIK